MLAAGILGKTPEVLRRVIDNGAGGVVTKSIGLNPRDGSTNPVIAKTPCGIINNMGLPNPGINNFRNELAHTDFEAPLIGSVYGFRKKDFAKVAIKFQDVCDAIELNLSCPNVKGTGGELFGQDPALVREITQLVKQKVQIPLFVKVTPNVSDITVIAKAAEEGGADAITAINTVKGMRINIEVEKPILSGKTGGLSGPAIKPIAVHAVYKLYQTVDVPIIGVGGITSWRDAIEFFLAGASALQLGTGVMTQGLEIFEKINKGIKRFLRKKDYSNLSNLIGNANC